MGLLYNFSYKVPSPPIFKYKSSFTSSRPSWPLLPSLNPLRRPQRQCLRRRCTRTQVVVSAQFNFFKVLQTAWRVGNDGIDASTKFVPDVVPRPVARIGVAAVVGIVSIVVLRSVISTAFFVLGMMGLIYFLYMAFNKDEGPKGGGGGGTGASQDETLEEARRIMEKYK